MNLKRTTTFAVVGGALAAWLAAAATSGRRVAAPFERHIDRGDISARLLATETARLHERLTPSAIPRRPGRDLFRFIGQKPHALPAPIQHLAVAAPETAPVPPPLIVRLVGLAEDKGADGAVLTAILGLPGGLVYVKEGETIEGRLMVRKIAADGVDIFDAATNGTLHLPLK